MELSQSPTVPEISFFVTFGQQQGEHLLDESITEKGVLSWQSQPHRSLNNHQIHQFINHDELRKSFLGVLWRQ